MPKPSLAFVDHSFHRKTHSSDFLRELFRETFEVHEYWDESWHKGSSVSPEEINKHDYVFFLQVLNPISELLRITIPMLWAPMYDGFTFNYSYARVLEQLDLKILSFSERISLLLSPFAIPVMNVHYYYLAPEQATKAVEGNHIFFWYRGGIDFDFLRSKLIPEQIDSFTLLEVPDKVGARISISLEDMNRYKITHLVENFLSRDHYLELVRNASIFIAPRKKEGIGAFTEALILGKCVIAYNDAVHNEYITDNVDGLLFTEETEQIDLSRTAHLAESARARAARGYDTWISKKACIHEFFSSPIERHNSHAMLWFWSLVYFCDTKARILLYHLKRISKITHYG